MVILIVELFKILPCIVHRRRHHRKKIIDDLPVHLKHRHRVETLAQRSNSVRVEYFHCFFFHSFRLDFIFLEMSAAEYRETLKARGARKRDPRQDQNLSMKQKHALIDGL